MQARPVLFNKDAAFTLLEDRLEAPKQRKHCEAKSSSIGRSETRRLSGTAKEEVGEHWVSGDVLEEAGRSGEHLLSGCCSDGASVLFDLYSQIDEREEDAYATDEVSDASECFERIVHGSAPAAPRLSSPAGDRRRSRLLSVECNEGLGSALLTGLENLGAEGEGSLGNEAVDNLIDTEHFDGALAFRKVAGDALMVDND